jgi:hypothetical protein
MRRRDFFALGMGAVGWNALRAGQLLAAQSAGDTNGAALDLMYSALELLSSHASDANVLSASRLLKNALDEEPNLGDAHYYRHLCLKHLNQDAVMQRVHLEAAKRYNAEALRDGRDPFSLAVPKIYDNLATVGQKFALVVGITQFQPKAGSKIGAERLPFAADDATAFAKVLRDPDIGRFPADQVYDLTNERATTSAIKARLNTIATKAKPEDMVLVYFATHGRPRADDLRQVSYLCTYDTDISSRDQMFGTALAMVDVSGIIANRCVAQRTVVIFDTCFSGAALGSKALSNEELDRLREGAGRYVLAACEPDQVSYGEGGSGFFTSSLIEQLRARQGCIRLKDLFASVQKDVSSRVQTRLQKTQRPVMANSAQAAEIILGAAVGGASEGCIAH